MRLDGLNHVPAALKGGVVAIGNFDGVHRGHQAVFERLRQEARTLGVPAIVLTFEPHPRDVFAPQPMMFRLTEADAKARLAQALGLDAIVVMPFTRDFSQIEAEDFVARFLVADLAVAGVIVGADFHFGRARRGTPDFLRAAGAQHGFGVTQLDLLDDGDEHVSSSRVRDALRQGDVDTANRLLGYHWFIEGVVEQGDQRGRELGYPTANIALPAQWGLAQGVYAVRARVGETIHDGVASFGKPMFGDAPPPFESHLFDFSGDLYGQSMAVALIGHVRGQARFGSLADLVTAMDADSVRARQMLAAARPLSGLDAALGFVG